MSGVTPGKLAVTLPLLLAGCYGSDRAERVAQQDRLKAQEKRIADQEREIASLKQQLAGKAAGLPAPPPRPASPVGDAEESPPESRWRLALTEVNHRSHSFRARFDVTNLAEKRQSGSLCVQLFDQSGTQVEHLFSPERAMPAGATEIIELDAPLSDRQWNDVARIEAYMAPLGCVDDPPAHPLSVDRKGRPMPQFDR